MHEYPITLNILKIAQNTAKERQASQIVRIDLVVGEMSGFIGDSIQMYFDAISKGTMAEGATLFIRYIKPKLLCKACGQYFERERYSFACPLCHGEGMPSDIGKEFYIESIEVI